MRLSNILWILTRRIYCLRYAGLCYNLHWLRNYLYWLRVILVLNLRRIRLIVSWNIIYNRISISSKIIFFARLTSIILHLRMNLILIYSIIRIDWIELLVWTWITLWWMILISLIIVISFLSWSAVISFRLLIFNLFLYLSIIII